jgi:hypothetical protein
LPTDGGQITPIRFRTATPATPATPATTGCMVFAGWFVRRPSYAEWLRGVDVKKL